MSLPTPLSREEQYLNRMAGGQGDIPEAPLNRIEEYLAGACANIGRVPECLTDTDGTYTLKATVADGKVTYAWVADV